MAALPYMQFYVADYLADTLHLTTEQHGAYILLIFNYWQSGKPIPVSRLQIITRLDAIAYANALPTLREFFDEKDGFWFHKRIEKDLEETRRKCKNNKKSAFKRWHGKNEEKT
jgi:uncharacterized protein YdaU (DUF1376 family)